MSKKKISRIGTMTRDMINDVMDTALKKPFQTGELRKNPVEPAWRCPAGYRYEIVDAGEFVMEYLQPEQVVTGRVILQTGSQIYHWTVSIPSTSLVFFTVTVAVTFPSLATLSADNVIGEYSNSL